MNRRKELDVDLKPIQQIEFFGLLKNGSIENTGYPNGLKIGYYLGTPKKKSVNAIENVVKVINS